MCCSKLHRRSRKRQVAYWISSKGLTFTKFSSDILPAFATRTGQGNRMNLPGPLWFQKLKIRCLLMIKLRGTTLEARYAAFPPDGPGDGDRTWVGPFWLSWLLKLKYRWLLWRRPLGMTSMTRYTYGSGGPEPVFQTKMAPDGLAWVEDVSPARWVESSLTDFAKVRSLLPAGLSAYARVFHPAYLDGERQQPVRWSTVASWTGRTAHPLMQFPRVAGLSEGSGDKYKDPPWGFAPEFGSIPDKECQALAEILRDFTSTPDDCFFCLWEGYGNIDARLYETSSRVKAPGRDYLLFSGPLEGITSFLQRIDGFWGFSPNIWWPADRAWCVATDIDLYDTYVGGSKDCIEAVLGSPDLEALPTTRDARVDIGGDDVNPPNAPRD